MKIFFIKFLASLCYIGHIPFAPGTIGSIAGLVIYFVVKENTLLYAAVAVSIFILGMVFASKAEKIYRTKDAGQIVIDEACGMLLTLAFLPYKLSIAISGFILFRIFDIIKFQPARRMESFAGSWGIMLDDIVSAIYANIVLQIVVRAFHLL